MPVTSSGFFYPDASSSMGIESLMAAAATSQQSVIDNLITNKRQIQSYKWADATARGAQTGMSEGDEGYQSDTKTPYRYNGSTWVPEFGGGLVAVVPASVAGTGVSVSATGLITFTNSSTITVNDVFDATGNFTDYRLVIRTTSVSTNLQLQMQLRRLGVDSNSTVYDSQWNDSIGGTATPTATNQLAQDRWIISGGTSAVHASTLDLFAPNIAEPTIGILNGFSTLNPATAASTTRLTQRGFQHRLSNNYSGFTIFTSTGTASGTIRVYGYR